VDKVESELRAELKSDRHAYASSLETVQSGLKQEIETVQSDLTASLETVQSGLKQEIDKASTDAGLALTDLAAQTQTLTKATDAHTELATEFNTLRDAFVSDQEENKARDEANTKELDRQVTLLKELHEAVTAENSEREGELAELRQALGNDLAKGISDSEARTDTKLDSLASREELTAAVAAANASSAEALSAETGKLAEQITTASDALEKRVSGAEAAAVAEAARAEDAARADAAARAEEAATRVHNELGEALVALKDSVKELQEKSASGAGAPTSESVEALGEKVESLEREQQKEVAARVGGIATVGNDLREDFQKGLKELRTELKAGEGGAGAGGEELGAKLAETEDKVAKNAKALEELEERLQQFQTAQTSQDTASQERAKAETKEIEEKLAGVRAALEEQIASMKKQLATLEGAASDEKLDSRIKNAFASEMSRLEQQSKDQHFALDSKVSTAQQRTEQALDDLKSQLLDRLPEKA